MVERASTSLAAEAPEGSSVKMAACCPFHDALAALATSAASLKVATGITGPNCSSLHSRMAGVTGYTMAGWKRAPRSVPPPAKAFTTVAPLAATAAASDV